MKCLITLVFMCIAFLANAQSDSVSVRSMIIKRPLWFYRNLEPVDRFTLASGEEIKYKPAPGETYYQAMYRRYNGYVEAAQVSEEYQGKNVSVVVVDGKVTGRVFDSSTPTPEPFIPSPINSAGTSIRQGATLLVAGALFSIASGAAGTAISKTNANTGTIVAVAGGGLGLILSIVGYSTIASGGRQLERYKF